MSLKSSSPAPDSGYASSSASCSTPARSTPVSATPPELLPPHATSVAASSSTAGATAAGQMSPSVPGGASILGAAILSSPRLCDPSKARTLAFDVQFWLGDNEIPLTACLRYYNGRDISFDQDRNVCVIFATITQSTSTAATYGGNDWTEYDLIGDIQWLFPAPEADPKIHPMMVVSGQANDIDRTASTFKLFASQYVQQLGTTGRLRTSITIPNTGRYKKAKPLPFSEGANATVTGTLTGVERVPSMDSPDIQLPDYFQLELGNVTYFPRSSNYTRPAETASGTPKKRQGWRFQFDDTQSPSADKGKKRMRLTDDE